MVQPPPRLIVTAVAEVLIATGEGGSGAALLDRKRQGVVAHWLLVSYLCFWPAWSRVKEMKWSLIAKLHLSKPL
jgi:hypothetical protein